MNCKKVLVIGGSGFIGAHLCKALSSLDIETTLFSKSADKIKKLDFSKKLRLIKGDIQDYKSVEYSIKGKDCIINLASVVNHYSDFNPYLDLDVNCRGQINVLEARKKINPNSKYIFIGSRTQFGTVGKKNLPVKEDDYQRPISLYGIHKQTAENYCNLYKKAFGIDSIILRLPQVYGPRLTCSDTHSIIIKVLQSEVKEGIFNVGAGKGTSLIRIAKRIVKICGSGSYKAVPFPKSIEKFELGSFYFDISKVKRQFKWKPRIGIYHGLRKTVEFCRRC